MAEGRMLKKRIANSEKLGRLQSDKARVLYFMMLPHLDVEGRLEANPRIIKGQITTMLSYSTNTIQVALRALADVGLLRLYSENGNQYVQYTRFEDFQLLNPDREAKSTIPAPTQDASGGIRRTPLKLSKDKISLSKGKYTDAFESFWKKFKGRWSVDKDKYVKVGKYEASQEWQKLTIEEQRKAWKFADKVSGKYVPDASRWLKRKMYDDYEK